MLLMQTGNTAKMGKMSTVEREEDLIRDEMTRMLQELPDNAIVKSQKTSKKHD